MQRRHFVKASLASVLSWFGVKSHADEPLTIAEKVHDGSTSGLASNKHHTFIEGWNVVENRYGSVTIHDDTSCVPMRGKAAYLRLCGVHVSVIEVEPADSPWLQYCYKGMADPLAAKRALGVRYEAFSDSYLWSRHRAYRVDLKAQTLKDAQREAIALLLPSLEKSLKHLRAYIT